MEHGSEESSGLGELFSKQVGHIPDKHLHFFAKWYALLSEEEQSCRMRDGPPFWLHPAADRLEFLLFSTNSQLLDRFFFSQYREKEGTCLANMVAMVPTVDHSPGGKMIQAFSKSQSSSLPSAAVDTLLTVHDRVVISHQDGGRWAVAIGTILSLTCGRGVVEVRILLDKVLPFDLNQLYRIDQAPGFRQGLVSSTFAELFASDSKRCVVKNCCPKQK